MSIRLLAHRLPLAAIVVIAAWPQQAAAQRRTGQSYEELRNRMVDEDIVGSGISDPRVIRAMRDTPRHEFIHQDKKSLGLAYVDMTLPIGEHQTITSPMLVAYMTEQLQPQADDRVLEIGTGSGYQAAVLSPLVKEVYTIEIVESLGKHARQTLKRLKYDNVFVKIGDGYLGWPDKAPFDKIIVTCSPEKVPQPLVDQLKEGGRMIVPVGERYQQVFHLLKKENGKLINEALRPTLFVPMTGEAEKIRKIQPDPLHPSLVNGGFEEIVGSEHDPVGWYYGKQMKVVTGPDAPEGKNYVTFSNTEPGRSSRLLQGFPIDGRKVRQLELSCMVRGTDMASGIAPAQAPQFAVLFLDDNRATVGQATIGPWHGSFGWKRLTRVVTVPAATREGIVNIGMLGGTGEVSYDDVQIRLPKSKTARE